MYLQSYLILVQLYVTSILIKGTQSYVLLAANLDDFKSIARKFVPEKLVDQLAELASKNSVTNKIPKFHDDTGDSSEQETTPVELPAMRREKDVLRVSKINFEQLVERVKERLQMDMFSKQTSTKDWTNRPPEIRSTRNKYARDYVNFATTPSEAKKPQRGIVKAPQRGKKINIKKSDDEDYTDNPIYKLLNQVHAKPVEGIHKEISDERFFSKVKMSKNDSYEDYEIPKREDKIFESVESEKRVSVTFKTTEELPITDVDIIQADEDIPLEDAKDFREYVADRGEEMKARTEDLWYDYNATVVTEDYQDTTTPAVFTTKKKQGTMFPKRDYYKMSSPNYVAKVPIVAEGYNFDEPLPEKDREPENLKRKLPIPPSIINGKVRFSK